MHLDDAGFVWVPVRLAGPRANANGLYVSAELEYGNDFYGTLRARADVLGPWEQYAIGSLDDGTWVLLSRANNLFASAELGYQGDFKGMLRARADVAGPWERYFLYQVGSQYAFQNATNSLFVSTEIGYGGDFYGVLRARASQIGAWELYDLPCLEAPCLFSPTGSAQAKVTIHAAKPKSVPAQCPMASGKKVACRRLISLR